MTSKRRRKLSPGETELMKVIWDLEPTTVREVLETVNSARKSPLSRNTVLVQMQRLTRKGWLRALKKGRGVWYSSTVSRESALDEIMDSLREKLFDGSTVSLVRCLIEGTSLTAEEVRELKRLINQAKLKDCSS